MAETVAALCRICAATCGILVTVEDGRAVEVRGDPDHPESRGYTCTKGRALAATCHGPDRLDAPLLHGRPAPWDVVLDDLGATLARLVREHGPDSVGYYSASGQFPDKAGLFAERRLFGAIGTRSRYTAASVDIYPALKAAELVTGYAGDLLPVWEPETSPRTVLIVGQNPVVSHGYLAFLTDPVRRIREFRKGGGHLCVLDPRRSETARLADQHLAPRPGTDPAVLAWLVRELLDDGADAEELARHTDPADVARLRGGLEPFTLARVAEVTGLDAAALAELLAAVRRSGRIACAIGTGATFGPHGLVTAWLARVLLIVTGSLDHEGGMRFTRGLVAPLDERTDWDPAPPGGRVVPGPPSRPDLPSFLGEFPVAALVDEIESGNLRALVVAGANPIASIPDPERTAAALARLEALVVLDVRANEVTDAATHVLPVNHQLERADITLRDRGGFTPAAVPLGADRRPAWWVHAQLARRLGLDVLDGLDPDAAGDVDVLQLILSGGFSGAGTVFDPDRSGADQARADAGRATFARLVAAGPHGEMAERRFGWVHRVLPDGRWRVAPEALVDRLPELLAVPEPGLVLVSGRLPEKVNSAPYGRPPGGAPRRTELLVHPDDAQRIGFGEDDLVRVATDRGTLELPVRFVRELRPGTVSINHGGRDHNVNVLTDRHRVDPLTGQPSLTAIAVTVEPLAAAGR